MTGPARAATVPVQRGVLRRLHPVAKLVTSLIVAFGLVLSIDVVSAGVAAVLSLLLFPLSGLSARQLAIRTAPVWVAAPLTGLTILLYGRTAGTVHFEFLLARISDGSIELALATTLRVLAIGLPAVVLFATVDATELADGLAQVLRLPARFVLGALAGLRLVSLLADDWRSLALARRARGVADTGRLRSMAGAAFTLLVLAIRRGSRLATAMEGRGFGGEFPRTWARESRLGSADLLLIAAGAAAVASAITVSALTGHWNFLVG
jgi:energy-coupling factor transport system permease protein